MPPVQLPRGSRRARRKCSRARPPLPQAVLFDLAVEALAVDAEEARGLVLVAAAPAQRGGDESALGLLERRHVAQVEGGGVGGGKPAHGGGQVGGRERVGGGAGARARDRVG